MKLLGQTPTSRLSRLARVIAAVAIVVATAPIAIAEGAPIGSPATVTRNISMNGSNICDLYADGTYIWVAAYGSNQVERINPTTGAVVGSPIAVGANPCHFVQVGNHLFVASTGSNTVTDINPTTATVTRTITLTGSGISGLAYDGTNMWATSYSSSKVERFNPSTGAIVGSPISVASNPGMLLLVNGHVYIPGSGSGNITDITISTLSVSTITTSGSNMASIAFDGASLWATAFSSAKVFRIDPSTNSVISSSNVGSQPTNVIYAGSSIWVGATGNDSVTQLSTTGNVVRTVHLGGGNISNLVYDGAVIWAPNFNGAYISQINATTGAVEASTLNVGSQPGTVLLESNHVWVASTGSNVVTQISGPTPTTTTTTSTTSTTVPTSSVTTAVSAQSATTVLSQSQIPKVSSTIASTAPTTAVAPTSTITNNTTTTVVVPSVPSADPGSGSAVIGGESIEPAITRENNQLIASAAGMRLKVSVVDTTGKVTPLDADGNVRLVSGSSIRLEISGMATSNDVGVWLFSTPRSLGAVSIDSQGSGTAQFAVPANLEDGQHRIAVDGVSRTGEKATIAIGVVAGSVKRTSTITRVLITIPIGLAMIAGLIIPSARRRKKLTTQL